MSTTTQEAPEVPITHQFPILAPGAADPCMHELGRKLGDLGYPNSVSRGENAFGHVDQSVMNAIDTFRAQKGIPEPGKPGSPYQNLRGWHLDPLTAQAILELHAAEDPARGTE